MIYLRALHDVNYPKNIEFYIASWPLLFQQVRLFA